MFEREGYYVSVFYAYIKSMGLEIEVEKATKKKRIDMVIKYPNAIFVTEFKVDGSNALAQIKAIAIINLLPYPWQENHYNSDKFREA